MSTFIKYFVIAIATVMCILELCSCGTKHVICDEGRFTCTKRFFGGEPIFKRTETTWWLWPEESEVTGLTLLAKRIRRKMIVCHNCRFEK